MHTPDLTLPATYPAPRSDSSGRLILPLPDSPFLRLGGTPGAARDLLQRLCASDLRFLPVGGDTQGQPQILLDRDGTLLDRLSVYLDADGAVIACTPERRTVVQQRIDSMIFLEALKVEPVESQDSWLVYRTEDSAWPEGVRFLLGARLGLGQGPLPEAGELRTSTPGLWAESLLDAGELPLWQPEFQVNPLYTPLASLVSFNKGCYPGQEIMARMESRGRIGWRLVCITLPGLPDETGITLGPEAGTAKLLGVLQGSGCVRVVCLVRPDTTSVECRIDGGVHHAELA